MSLKAYEENDIKNIANAIREKNGSIESYKVSEMSEAIKNISSGGIIKVINGMKFGFSQLTDFSNIDTSETTDFDRFFYNCALMITSPSNLNSSNVVRTHNMFQGCSNLVTVKEFDFSNVEGCSNMFYNCSKLENVPVFNGKNVTNATGMYNGCSKLSDDSLNNIMAFCISMEKIPTYYKYLNHLKLTSSQIEKCKTLSNYEAFINAGWSAS